jgi:hypothetical protein
MNLETLKLYSDLALNGILIVGGLVALWYGGGWYKEYLLRRRDELFKELIERFQNVYYLSLELLSLLHRGREFETWDAEQQLRYVSAVGDQLQSVQKALMDFNFVNARALPLVSKSFRVVCANISDKLRALMPAVTAAMATRTAEGFSESAEDLKGSWLPKMHQAMLDFLFAIQEESVKWPKLRSHVSATKSELRAAGMFPYDSSGGPSS